MRDYCLRTSRPIKTLVLRGTRPKRRPALHFPDPLLTRLDILGNLLEGPLARIADFSIGAGDRGRRPIEQPAALKAKRQ